MFVQAIFSTEDIDIWNKNMIKFILLYGAINNELIFCTGSTIEKVTVVTVFFKSHYIISNDNHPK